MLHPYHVAVLARAADLPSELFRIVLITVLYASAIFGWGGLVCRRLSRTKETLADFVAARCITGCFILYTAFILLSAVAWLRPPAIATVCALGLIPFVFEARPLIQKLRQELRKTSEWNILQRLSLAVICLLLVLQIACGLTPLTFYDSQVYLLLAPVEFLKAGRLVHIPWNVLTNGPMALQLTFGMSWLADGTGGVFKLLMTVFGCLAVLAAGRVGSEIGTRSAIASALFVAVYPEFWIHQTFGVVDLTIAAFVVFGTVWWIEALKQEGWQSAILAGIAFGFATASRYQSAVLVPWIILGTFAVESVSNPKIVRESLKKSLVVAAIVAVMILPWLLRNYLIFRNPVFPLLPGILGGTEWSLEQARGLHQEVMGPTLFELPLRKMLAAPINAMLMFPSNGLLGFAMLIGGVLAAFRMSTSRIRTYALLGLGGTIIWGLIHPTPGVQLLRFNSASVILLLACTGAVLGSEGFKRWEGMYIVTALALGSAVIGLLSLTSLMPVLPSLSNSSARAQLWQANVPSWRVMDFANKQLDPARHKVLFIGETRAVWMKIPFIAPSALNGAQLLEVFSSDTDPAAWTQRLHGQGVTHILICSSEWQRLADGYGYFRLSDEHLRRFYQWIHTLRLVFDDHRGNVLLSI